MGMFDKDKAMSAIPIQKFVDVGERFVVYAVGLSKHGIPADKTNPGELVPASWLLVGRLVGDIDSAVTQVAYVSAIGKAIVSKIPDASPEDFPAVCEMIMVPSTLQDARVVRFLSEYEGVTPSELFPNEKLQPESTFVCYGLGMGQPLTAEKTAKGK